MKVKLMMMMLVGLMSSLADSNLILGQETIVETDFKTERAYDHNYAFAGYGIEGETEATDGGEMVAATNAVSATGGNPGECGTATLDATKYKLPDNATYDYVGWAFGSALDFETPWKDMEIGNYSISFDAKVTGTKVLDRSKMIMNFVVPDNVVAEDDDEFEDIVVGFIRGDDEDGDLITLNDTWQTFTFNLKDDLTINQGAVAKFKDYSVERINIAIQAQGDISMIGKDADNVLFVDNIKLIKVK